MLSEVERNELGILEDRIRILLPEEYQDSYEEIEPVSMGSASLKYDTDGKVAWNEVWSTFCDLAMAGGPPHKGTLLEPASREDIAAQPERYRDVAAEICRGITLAANLPANPSSTPGWIRVDCPTATMAGWLLRAITMENVAVRAEGDALFLPAGPSYRVEKEIKNVVTVIAKTSHYWLGHMPRIQHRAIANLFAEMDSESPLIEPAPGGGNWRGVECSSVRAAIWMMRGLVATNILSRREGTVLFLPINPATDPDGEIVARSLARIRSLFR